MLIPATCKPNIQCSLKQYATTKDCWRQPQKSYAMEGFTHKQLWANFQFIVFTKEKTREICNTNCTALDKCPEVQIAIQNKFQVLQPITILDGHFPHWATNKCQ